VQVLLILSAADASQKFVVGGGGLMGCGPHQTTATNNKLWAA